MKDPAQTILDTLAEIGPARLGAIADHAGCSAQSLKESLKRLRAEGKIISTGATTARIHRLPDQKLSDAQPSPKANGKPKGPRKHKAAKKRHPKKRAHAAREPKAPPCVAAITADRRLVVIGADPAPRIYTPEQTLAVAGLILDNFSA